MNIEKHGVHGPNAPFTNSDWWRLGASGARHIKLLSSDHRPADAQQARDLGLAVLVRVPGEAVVHVADVQATIAAYRGLATVLEIGNEPPADRLWDHAWYSERVWQQCAADAHAAGMRLCVGGWPAGAAPPDASTDLGRRLRAVYGAYDAIGVHCYDPFDLTIPPVQAHLAAWHNAFPDKPVYITEYGCAARAVGDVEKARRYGAFVAGLPAWVEAAYCFLLGGTNTWYSFNSSGTADPQGENGYVLSPAGWAALGRAVGG